MKKKIIAGLGILFAAVVLAFAVPSYEDMQLARSTGYDWGYNRSNINGTVTEQDGATWKAAEERGFGRKTGLYSYFVDGAKIGWKDKKDGKDYNNPYTVVTYIYNY